MYVFEYVCVLLSSSLLLLLLELELITRQNP